MRRLLPLLALLPIAACAGPPAGGPFPTERTNFLPMTTSPAEYQERLRQYERAVAEVTRDPERARFRYTRIVDTPAGEAICGEINGVNAFGGATGYLSFFAQILTLRNGDPRSIMAPAPWFEDRIGARRIAQACGRG